MIFHGYTISALGRCANKEKHDSDKLAREAVEFFGAFLDRHGNKFQAVIPLKGVGRLDLDWTSDHLSCAMATFASEGELLATDVIVSGISPQADMGVLKFGQTALENVCGMAEESVFEDLLKIGERPALASIRWSSESRKTMDLLADMEVCLAAAFLERAFKEGALAP
jgi:hypothetical protein